MLFARPVTTNQSSRDTTNPRDCRSSITTGSEPTRGRGKPWAACLRSSMAVHEMLSGSRLRAHAAKVEHVLLTRSTRQAPSRLTHSSKTRHRKCGAALASWRATRHLPFGELAQKLSLSVESSYGPLWRRWSTSRRSECPHVTRLFPKWPCPRFLFHHHVQTRRSPKMVSCSSHGDP